MAKEEFKFKFRLRVRWGECDAQGIVFNAQYMNFIEVSQAEYFRNLGLRLYSDELRSRFDLATVKATFEFMAPARVDDMLSIYTGVARIGNSSITFNTEMYFEDAEQPCARAEVIYVNFNADTGVARRIPDDIRGTIGEFEEIDWTEQPYRTPSPC